MKNYFLRLCYNTKVTKLLSEWLGTGPMKPGNLRETVRCQHLQTRKGLDDKGDRNRQNSRKHVNMRPFQKGRFCWFFLSLSQDLCSSGLSDQNRRRKSYEQHDYSYRPESYFGQCSRTPVPSSASTVQSEEACRRAPRTISQASRRTDRRTHDEVGIKAWGRIHPCLWR